MSNKGRRIFKNLPFSIKLTRQKHYWYWKPVSETCKRSVAEISYKRDGDVYSHSHFWFYDWWCCFWLCFVFRIEFKRDTDGFPKETEVRHEKPLYISGDVIH